MARQCYPAEMDPLQRRRAAWGRRAAAGAAICLLALLATSAALARRPVTWLTGHWTATNGPAQVLRGTWSAEISPRKPNEAHGYWRLFSENGEMLVQGKWSARKTGHGWNGTWKAQSGDSQPMKGKWHASISGSNKETFVEMLKSTDKKIVTGNWEHADYAGNWWLRGRAASQ